MERAFNAYLTTEERIIEKMKQDERSTYWLGRKLGKSQTYCYRLLYGKGEKKIELTDEILSAINEVFPGSNFSILLPHEQENQSLKDRPLFKDE